jgi:hypothetical protein
MSPICRAMVSLRQTKRAADLAIDRPRSRTPRYTKSLVIGLLVQCLSAANGKCGVGFFQNRSLIFWIPDKACIGALGQSLPAAPLGVRVVESLRQVASPGKEPVALSKCTKEQNAPRRRLLPVCGRGGRECARLSNRAAGYSHIRGRLRASVGANSRWRPAGGPWRRFSATKIHPGYMAIELSPRAARSSLGMFHLRRQLFHGLG